LSNEALLRNTQTLVTEERKLTTEILWHLHEIQVRRLYAEKGYRSLFEYAVQALGYSEAAAGRRIAAMRLLLDVPEIEPALKTGHVSLSTLSTIQSFIQRKDEPLSKLEKKELVLALQGKSRRECEKYLVELDPVAATPKEKERVISSNQTEIRFVADDELMQKLQKIKELDGHTQSKPSYLELFHRMADLALNKLDPLSKKKATPPAESSQAQQRQQAKQPRPSDQLLKSPRYIPAQIRRAVWMRDKSQCSYISPEGRRCGSKFTLEIDHKVPVAWGGKSEPHNLQILCREHNRLKALTQMGPAVMNRFIR
jgi:5-methylcytosine-specific restriction endonuclease McrA